MRQETLMSARTHTSEGRPSPLVMVGLALLAVLGAAARRIPALTACGGSRGGASCECGPL